MGFQLLSFVFRVGGLIAASPPSINLSPLTWKRKMYNTMLFALFVYRIVSLMRARGFFLTHERINLIEHNLNYWCICAQNFYIILVLNLYKHNNWVRLIENLKTSGELLQIPNNNKPKLFINFLITNLLHLTLNGGTLYIFSSARTNYLQEYFVIHFHVYLDFFNKCLSCVILQMITTRYKHLRRIILANTKRNQIRTSFLKKVEYSVRFLKNTVDSYNDLFGWSVFFNIAFTILQMINSVTYVLFVPGRLNFVQQILIQLSLIFAILVSGDMYV